MATALGAQLKVLATAPGRDTSTIVNRTRTRPSLLFDPRQAADIDLQAIFSIAQTGLEELVEMNDAFLPFKKTLFSTESIQTDRELQTKEFNDKLNKSISQFLQILSGFILLSPAHQVLEYLIRRYKIYIHNVDEVMISILPFHETSIFVRIVQLLKLEKTRWEFLQGVKQSGAAIPREVAVQRCTHDMAFLEAVCEAGMMGAHTKVKSLTHVTFSSVVIMETVSAVSGISKELVNRILPFILRAFEKDMSDDYRVGALMIVGLLSNRATLTKKLCSSLLESMAKVIAKSDSMQLNRLFLMAMIEVLQTQELDSFPPKAFKLCLKAKALPSILAELAKTFDVDKFILLLVSSLAEHCIVAEYYENMFIELIDMVPGNEQHVECIVSRLIKANLEKGKEDPNFNSTRALERTLSAMEKRFPSELDKYVKSLFEAQNSEFIEVLNNVLKGSIRRPMQESGSSLYASVDHPQAEIRKTAIQRISELSQRPLDNETALFIRETLLHRLSDSDLSVVKMVLSMDNLKSLIPQDKLSKCLGSVILRAMELLETGPKSLKADATQVVKASLKILESCILDQDESIVKEAQRCLLCHILVKPKTRKLNLQVLKVAAKYPVFLFRDFRMEDAESPKEEMSKEQSKLWRLELNDKHVTAISNAILEDHSLMSILLESAADNDNAKVLSGLIILKCFLKDHDGKLRELSRKCLPYLRKELDLKDQFTEKLLKIDYESQSLGTELYERLEMRENEAYTEVILLSLYRMIPCLLPSNENNEQIFLLFAGSPSWEVFKPHILCFLKLMPNGPVSFLLEISTMEGISVAVNVHIFAILSWYISEHLMDEEQMQLALVGSLIGIANPLKSVRAAALRCIKAIKGSAKGSNDISKLVQGIVDNDENFMNDHKFLSCFFNIFFNADESDEQKKCVLTTLVDQALKLPLRVQLVFFDVLLHEVECRLEKASATQSTLFQLLQRRKSSHLTHGLTKSESPLNQEEVKLMDKLLEINLEHVHESLVCKQQEPGEFTLWALFEALEVEGGSFTDGAVIEPCLLALKFLSPELYTKLPSQYQDLAFEALIELTAVPLEMIRSAAREALDSLEIKEHMVSKHIDFLYTDEHIQESGRKKKRVKRSEDKSKRKAWPSEGKLLKASVSLLEYLLRKTKLHTWEEMLSPLCNLLRAHRDGKWPKPQMEVSEGDIQYLAQLTLSVIENSVLLDSEREHVSDLDVDLIVHYVKSTDIVTRNHALGVITAAGKMYPESVLPHVIQIVSIVGSSTVKEDDNHSHTIVQQMLESVVPFWLKEMKDPKSLLQVFLEALPAIPAHRQTDLVKCVLRVTNEESSISTFLLLLIRHSVKVNEEWPLNFGEKLSMSYEPQARVSAIVKLSGELLSIDIRKEESILQVGTRFIASQLQRLELEFFDNDTDIQDACSTLMEHALKQVELLGHKKKSISTESKTVEYAHLLLDAVIRLMSPAILCKTVAYLLRNSNNAIRQKVLQIYVAKLKEKDTLTSKNKVKGIENSFTKDSGAHMEIVLEISKLLESPEGEISSRTKQAAVSAMDMTVQIFGVTCASLFVTCLPAVLKNFSEQKNIALVVASVRCTASILSAAGPEALPCLPAVMKSLLEAAQKRDETDSDLRLAVASTLEAAVERLGAFLSPYIEDIVRLLISPEYTDDANILSVSSKLASVRNLVSEKLPARLLLDPLIRSYTYALDSGDKAMAVLFQMLSVMCTKLDRSTVSAYHAKIFQFCMEAFDLRRKMPKTLKSVTVVEESVISAVASLVMKLSETTFRPLFVAVQEWASSTVLDGEVTGPSIERSIVFYKLVNMLASKLRSVFVPYFRYLLEGCLVVLGKTEGLKTSKSKKKKTLPVSATGSFFDTWQLKHLVVSALHKCFLYDTLGFLDSTRFQQLLQPLANQLLEEAPAGLEDLTNSDVPRLSEADEALVSCLGRMALSAGTDALHKPLNHEVLMKTRSGSLRAKRLALDIVKFLAENLREDYLVLIPETIPFLSELLEDQDLSIVSKTQQVIKLLEELSGESLKQYM